MLRNSVPQASPNLLILRRPAQGGYGPVSLAIRHNRLLDDLSDLWRDSFWNSSCNRVGIPSHNQMMTDLQSLMDDFYPPTASRTASTAGPGMEVKYNQKEFGVQLDVRDFKPEELEVKVIGDQIEISGKLHNEDEHGSISKKFARQFLIPKDVDKNSIESHLTDEGFLVIKGRVEGAEKIEERNIEIQHKQDKETKKD